MLQRNESADYDGLFQMYTGTDDIQKVKKIFHMNFLTLK